LQLPAFLFSLSACPVSGVPGQKAALAGCRLSPVLSKNNGSAIALR